MSAGYLFSPGSAILAYEERADAVDLARPLIENGAGATLALLTAIAEASP